MPTYCLGPALDLYYYNLFFLIFSDPVEPRPPGEDEILPSEAVVCKILDLFTDAPLIGIEFIVEILRDRDEPTYHCLLCQRDVDAKGLISDLLSGEHRMHYIVSFIMF